MLPTIIVLVLLAVPPILTGTYAGIQNADPDAVGAARGMGFTKRQILLRVQLPCALPLMISGVRSSTLQIVSTATIAAYLGLQGLGRFILDGRAQANFAEMAGGAILVAVLATPSRIQLRLARSAHRVAGSAAHRSRNPRHQSPRPSRAGRHLGAARRRPHIRRNIMKNRASSQPWPSPRCSRCPHAAAAAGIRSPAAATTSGSLGLAGHRRFRRLHRKPADRQHLLAGAAGRRGRASRNSSTSAAARSTSRRSRTGPSIWCPSTPARC